MTMKIFNNFRQRDRSCNGDDYLFHNIGQNKDITDEFLVIFAKILKKNSL